MKFIILEDFIAKQTQLNAGDIVDDQSSPQFSEWLRSGLVAVEYIPALMEEPRQRYLVQRDTGDKEATHFGLVLANLLTSNAGAGMIRTSTGQTLEASLGGMASGDVVGPASATDGAVALFDGTTGKLLQNSTVTIDLAGNISTAGTIDGVDVSAHAARHLPSGADPLAVATPLAIGAANSAGTANSFVRSDHIHAHGAQPSDGTLHALAIASGAAGFISGSDQAKLDGIAAGAQADHGLLLAGSLLDDDHTQYLLVAGTRAMTGDLNMGGQSVTNVNLVDGVDVAAHASRHQPGGSDAIPTATAVTIGTANAEGTSTSLARADHSHSHGAQTDPTHHAVAIAGGNAGFLSGSDKTKIDNLIAASSRIYAPSATDPVSPAPANGDQYYNTAINQMMQYDGSRSKWLSIAEYCVQVARAGTINGAVPSLRTWENMVCNGTAPATSHPAKEKITITELVVRHTETLGPSTFAAVDGAGVDVATIVHPGDGLKTNARSIVNADVNPQPNDDVSRIGGRWIAGADALSPIMQIYYRVRA